MLCNSFKSYLIFSTNMHKNKKSIWEWFALMFLNINSRTVWHFEISIPFVSIPFVRQFVPGNINHFQKEVQIVLWYHTVILDIDLRCNSSQLMVLGYQFYNGYLYWSKAHHILPTSRAQMKKRFQNIYNFLKSYYCRYAKYIPATIKDRGMVAVQMSRRSNMSLYNALSFLLYGH